MKPVVSYALPLALAGALLAGCSSGESDDDGQVEAGHTHAPGQGHTSLAVGDGTSVSEVGYSLAGLQVREQPDGIGELRFRIDDHEGEPVTDYVEELTKELHLYVVNDELTVFRHLHPTRDEDGSWTAPFDVPDAGGYRVVAEFIAVDEGGNGMVLTSIHGRSDARTYAKDLAAWAGTTPLSPEEEEAVTQAKAR